jgi:hypothetical protein
VGHTKITTTQVYAKVIESKLSDDMKLLKQKLGEKSTVTTPTSVSFKEEIQ